MSRTNLFEMKHYAKSWTWETAPSGLDEYDNAVINMIDGSLEALEEIKKGGLNWSLSEDETRELDKRIDILKEFKERFENL